LPAAKTRRESLESLTFFSNDHGSQVFLCNRFLSRGRSAAFLCLATGTDMCRAIAKGRPTHSVSFQGFRRSRKTSDCLTTGNCLEMEQRDV
jgi:hypothetical protein